MKSNHSQKETQPLKNTWIIVSIFLTIILLTIGYQVYKQRHKIGSEEQRLLSLDIASILIETNDLPAGYSPGQVGNIKSDEYFRFAQGKEQEIIAADGTQVGIVSTFLFVLKNEQHEIFSAYSQVESQEGIIPYVVTGIGDCESCSSIFSISGCDIRVVFNRCAAVGVIELNAGCVQKEYDFNYLVSHAKRLDESLKSIACQ
jgi:hypothetical protein